MSLNFASELTTKQKKNMDTINLNTSPISGEKSEKSEKIKKAAGKAAQFTGAAGLGVAGTMAANAMNNDIEDNTDNVSTESPITTDAAPNEEVTAEVVTDFDPNDIMIEAEEVEVVDDNKTETAETTVETSNVDVALVEPQPITGMVDVEHTTEVLIAEVDPHVDDVMYGGPDGWDDFDHDDLLAEDDTLLADNDDVNDDLDIADDILA